MELPLGTLADLRDEKVEPIVISSEVVVEGKIFDLRRDTVDLGDHGSVTREYLHHTGAVIVVALREIDGDPCHMERPVEPVRPADAARRHQLTRRCRRGRAGCP